MTVSHERLLEFERGVLGSMMMDERAIEVVSTYVDASEFVSAKHQAVFETVLAMYNESKPIDILTVTTELKRYRHDTIVSPADVASLTNAVPSAANVRYYADQVVMAAKRRRLLMLARKAQNEIEEGADETEVIDGIEQALIDISSGKVSHGYAPAHLALLSAQQRIDLVRSVGDDVWAAKTGIERIDKFLGGLEAEDYMVIGARPSVGKSAIALQMAMNMAFRQRKSVGFFTLEMADNQLMLRAIAQELKLDSRKLRLGHVSQSEMKRIIEFGEEVTDVKLFINDTPNIALSKLRAQARTIKQREGMDVMVVDYLTLIRGDSRVPRWEMVTMISAAMKELARELKVAVIALSQLSRDSENKRPTLASLRESGAIEQDADIVLLLHRPKEPELDWAGNVQPAGVEFILAKNRNGPVGSAYLIFHPQYTRFEEAGDGTIGD